MKSKSIHIQNVKLKLKHIHFQHTNIDCTLKRKLQEMIPFRQSVLAYGSYEQSNSLPAWQILPQSYQMWLSILLRICWSLSHLEEYICYQKRKENEELSFNSFALSAIYQIWLSLQCNSLKWMLLFCWLYLQ
jgi:hypothetical protein